MRLGSPRLAAGFLAVVGLDQLPKATIEHQLFDYAADAVIGERTLDFDRCNLLVRVIPDYQVLDDAAVGWAVEDQVPRLYFVGVTERVSDCRSPTGICLRLRRRTKHLAA